MVRIQTIAGLLIGQSTFYVSAASIQPLALWQADSSATNLISSRNLQGTDDVSITVEPAAPMIMTPLRINRGGNTKRDRREALAPQAEESLYWSAQDGTVAELTLSMPGENENIVNLERIDDMVRNIECLRNGTGQVKIQFAEEADFDDAEDIWQWVNQEPGNHFTLLVGAGACGWNENQRVLYTVTGLVYNDESETVILEAETTTWKDSVHTFSLNIGKPAVVNGAPVQRRTMAGVRGRRGFFDKVRDALKGATDKVVDTASDIVGAVGDATDKAVDTASGVADKVVDTVTDAAGKAKDAASDAASTVGEGAGQAADKAVDTATDIVNNVGDATDKAVDKVVDVVGDATDTVADTTGSVVDVIGDLIDPDHSADFSIPFDSDFTGKSLTFSVDGVDVTASCTECTTTGSFNIRGSFRVNQFLTEEAWIELSTGGVTAKAVLGLTLKGALTGKLAEKSVPIVKFSPAGVSIPGVLTIGPTISVNLGAEISEVRGSVGVTLGGTATIPASSSRLDFLSEDKTTATGWEPTFDVAPFKADASVEAKATAFLKAAVGLEISAVETGFSAELSANLPALTASLKAVTSATCTVCGDHQSGIQGSLTLGTSVGVSLKKKVLGDEEPLWSLSFADAKLADLAAFCLGIGPSGDQCLAKRFAEEWDESAVY
ncbi:hypothetical protein SAPIO_CDS8972 [Scedosporium apiospermum]|uniref:Uncharacterized protein n=1 Tax=Pseudallescheria apiosperma TaxID=563466 RepID=A0A084FY30_PSEDA|nr:uncharacterized protein SAPIO_CDS8972 [Scedosporium apiospermum]KEZ39992.1 hypothetical protein SAPIO_CDS8972 [Scedosporium apiospermum]